MAETDTQTTGQADPTTDNPEPQTSEASEATQDTPEATQDQATAQEAEAPDTSAEDKVDEELLAGKFKTPEDLEKAYKELESRFGQETSKRAELTRTLNESMAPPEDTPAPTGSDAATDKLARDSAVIKFILSHPDADSGSMQEVLTSDPYIQSIQGHEARLEYAYLRSQNMSHQKAIAEAEKQATEQAQAKYVEKEAAKVESAQKAEPTDEANELMNLATTGNPTEREEARQQLIRKHLVDI